MTTTIRRPTLAVAIAALLITADMSEGAYFSQSWGWVALAFLVPTTILLILGRASAPGPLRAAFALVMSSLAVWIALSAIWSISASASAREVERMFVYVATALAVALFLRRGDISAILAGVLAATTIVSCYAVVTRLFPDRVVVDRDPLLANRLAEPLGFPNSVGVLAAIGLLVCVGFVAQSRRPLSAAAAGLAAPTLAATLYFTFSRGAWAALVLAYVLMLIVDPRRHVLLWSSFLTALPAAACLFVASRTEPLTRTDLALNDVPAAGQRFGVVLVLAALVSALAAYLAHRLIRTRRSRTPAARVTQVGLAAAAVTGLVVAVIAVGGPAGGLRQLRESFATEPVGHQSDLNSRLFTVYGTGRAELWTVAWQDFRRAPIVGQGAGTFEYSWYENRRSTRIVRDAHSLYLETSGELGIVGLMLLVSVILLPAVAAFRARGLRYTSCGLGALVAWAGGSAVDWHWEMVSLTVTALLAGSVGLLAVERGRTTRLVGARHGVALGCSVVLSLAAVWSLVGNQALFAGKEALRREEWRPAAENARRARALLPWSFEPDVVLGDAEAGLGDRDGALRAYRTSVARDPKNWVTWLRLAQVALGAERAEAYARVHELNPIEQDLPGEESSSG